MLSHIYSIDSKENFIFTFKLSIFLYIEYLIWTSDMIPYLRYIAWYPVSDMRKPKPIWTWHPIFRSLPSIIHVKPLPKDSMEFDIKSNKLICKGDVNWFTLTSYGLILMIKVGKEKCRSVLKRPLVNSFQFFLDSKARENIWVR